ncbi:LutC/YkgG family protein [Thermoflavimicrobium daqui]|nr:LUD domain-containing protein [Thermoflavimicrobium daqui]
MNKQDRLLILKSLEEESKKKEEAFFSRIANRLGRPRMTTPPVQPVRGVPDFWKQYALQPAERVELFMKNWADLGGVAKRFSTKVELSTWINQISTEWEAKRLIRWDHSLLNDIHFNQENSQMEITVWNAKHEELLGKAARADIGLVVADYAIAHTGTAVVTSGAKRGRSVSLLPTVLIVIIPTCVIKTKMGEVLAEIHRWDGKSMPAGIHFITGPSRSSDIENDLTIGVHGPGIVYALILEENHDG